MNTKMIIAVILVAGCTSQPTITEVNSSAENHVVLTQEQMNMLNIQTDTLKKAPSQTVVRFSAILENSPEGRAVVSPRMGAYVKTMLATEGALVRRGQILVELENLELIRMQEEYLSANAELDFLQKELSRQRQLNQNKTISDKTLQETEMRFHQISAKCSALTTEFKLLGIDANKISPGMISGNYNLVSPIDGIITHVSGSVGAYLNPSDVVVEISDKSDLLLVGRLYERDRDKVNIGGKVRFYLNSSPGTFYNAEVVRISGRLNDDNSLSVYCTPTDLPGNLSAGMIMNAELFIPTLMSISIPDNAVVSFENKNYIFISDKSNEFIMTEVEILDRKPGEIQIADTILDHRIFVNSGAHSLLMTLKNIAEE